MAPTSDFDFSSSPSLMHVDPLYNPAHPSQICSSRPPTNGFNAYNTYDSYIAPTIATATSSDLLNARNAAYIDLINAYKQSKAEVQRQE
ncbi:hypothetical protein C0992_012053 [Termitomyces sp. T32_za158]|nr:hypothetical protein C0992_012053 [Termitomyces sp. T32_za158]